MNIFTRFLIAGLLTVPALLIAQAPVAHLLASNNAVCDSIYSENFYDLSTNHPTSWKWYFSGATPDTSTLQNPTNIIYKGYGCYTAKLVVKNNYGSDSLIDSNAVCLDSSPHIILTGDFRACLGYTGGMDTICASGGTSYYWSTGSTTPCITFPYPMVSYTIGVWVYKGACHKDTVFAIRIDTMPTFRFKADTFLCQGQSTTIYAYNPKAYKYRYLWNTGVTTDSLVTGILYKTQTYYVTVSKGVCTRDSSQIAIKVHECNTGVDNYSNSFKFMVYPNPNNGVFILQNISEYPIANSYIEIYNVLGQQIYWSGVEADNTKININGQPQGVYLYRVITETGGLVGEGKIVIKK